MTEMQYNLEDLFTQCLLHLASIDVINRSYQFTSHSKVLIGKKLSRLEYLSKREGKTLDILEVLAVRSYPGLLESVSSAFCLKIFRPVELKYQQPEWEVQTGIPKHLQKDDILGGVHETKGEICCFLMAEDASVSIPTRNILCFKKKDTYVTSGVGLKGAKCH